MKTLFFLPEEIFLEGQRGDTLLDAALDNGIEIEHECGGNCACTTCVVQVLEGAHRLSAMASEERDRLETLEENQKSPDTRLACQAILERFGGVKVRRLNFPTGFLPPSAPD